LKATRKDLVGLNKELSKVPEEKITKYLSEAMFVAISNSITPAEFQETIETLLKYGADINYTHNNSTVLLTTLASKMWPAAEWIISRKADLSMKDNLNRNCLHIIIENYPKDTKPLKLMAKLIELGVNPLDEDISGNTALHKACEKVWVDAIQLLIRYKGTVLHKNSISLDTPLHVIARQRGLKAVECAKKLLTAGALVKAFNKKQKTPLDDAITKGNAEMKELLEKKMNEQYYMEQQALNMCYGYPPVQPMYEGMGGQMYQQPYPVMYQSMPDEFSYNQVHYQRNFTFIFSWNGIYAFTIQTATLL
jgi:ankyrin repeat protein